MRHAWCGMRFVYGNTTEIQRAKKASVCLCRGGSVTPPKQIVHIIDLTSKQILIKLLLKPCPVVTALQCLFSNMPKFWTTIWCGEIRTILQDNLKSGQIVRETPVPDVIFWIPRPVFIFCRTNRYMERFSLPYPHRCAAAGQIACRIRKYGIALVCLHAVPFLPRAAHRVYHIWNLNFSKI